MQGKKNLKGKKEKWEDWEITEELNRKKELKGHSNSERRLAV